jgi:hypothetical protein
MLNENRKIGIGLVCGGLAFISIGILMFFDSRIIAIGNAMFLLGLCFTLGIQGTMNLFTRRDRLRGTVCMALGLAMILFNKFVIIGMGLEAFGFMNLFANFLPIALTFAREMPVLRSILNAPGISSAADFVAGKSQPKYSV